MKHRKLYCRMMYSMAYVFAVAIVAFSYLGIPNSIMISLAITCLVAGGFLSIRGGEHEEEKLQTTTLEEEMNSAREAEAKDSEGKP
jgi:hypothetical protein